MVVFADIQLERIAEKVINLDFLRKSEYCGKKQNCWKSHSVLCTGIY